MTSGDTVSRIGLTLVAVAAIVSIVYLVLQIISKNGERGTTEICGKYGEYVFTGATEKDALDKIRKDAGVCHNFAYVGVDPSKVGIVYHSDESYGCCSCNDLLMDGFTCNNAVKGSDRLCAYYIEGSSTVTGRSTWNEVAHACECTKGWAGKECSRPAWDCHTVKDSTGACDKWYNEAQKTCGRCVCEDKFEWSDGYCYPKTSNCVKRNAPTRLEDGHGLVVDVKDCAGDYNLDWRDASVKGTVTYTGDKTEGNRYINCTLSTAKGEEDVPSCLVGLRWDESVGGKFNCFCKGCEPGKESPATLREFPDSYAGTIKCCDSGCPVTPGKDCDDDAYPPTGKDKQVNWCNTHTKGGLSVGGDDCCPPCSFVNDPVMPYCQPP